MEPWMLDEIRKCAKDPIYFIKNYIYINTKDHGMQLFGLRDYQEDVINKFHNNRFIISKWSRQSGKSSTTVAYLLWYALFHKEKTVAILANKLSLAQEQLQHLRDAYINLPYWMQPGVSQWNKRGIQLSHGTRVICAATSTDNVCGMALNVLYIDEMAFIKPHIADEFIASIFPTIASGKTTKMIISSTPNGMNQFFRMWENAKGDSDEGNGFVKSEIAWNAVPGRDEEWANSEKARIGEIRFNQEFLCLQFNETVVIKNKLTGCIENIKIGDFYERIKNKRNHM